MSGGLPGERREGGGSGYIVEASGIVVRETSLKVSSSRRPSARISRASSDNGDAPRGGGKKRGKKSRTALKGRN